jgi:lysozyme
VSTDDRAKLRAQLKRHESERLKPYMDCCGKPWRECACVPQGKLTIGVGRNLDDDGITSDESAYMNTGDMDRVIRGLFARYPSWFPNLDSVRQAVLVNMGFNLGLAGLAGFTKMLDCVARGDYGGASEEMTRSRWASQVGSRAAELTVQMRTGAWIF